MKCLDNVVDGILIQDLLRDMLLNEESENAELFSDDDKKQMIFRLLFHLVSPSEPCSLGIRPVAMKKMQKKCSTVVYVCIRRSRTF